MNSVKIKNHFLIFAIIIALWSVSLYFYNKPILYRSSEWLKITVFLTIIAIFELFYFISVIFNISLKQNKIPLIISSIFAITIIFAFFFNNEILPPQLKTFLLLLFIYSALGVAILLERSFKSSAIGHLRAVYILVSFGVFIIATTLLYVFLPIISGQKEHFWFGPIFALLFLLSSFLGYYLTKEVETRKEAERLAEEWEKLAQAKDQFLLSLQHHLRTPVTPLKGYLEMILEGTYGQMENPAIKEKLIEMKKLVDTLYSLMENLLDIQEFRIKKKVLNLESCQIKNLIQGIIEELKPEAEQKGLYLKFETFPRNAEELPMIKLDKRRIREAIWNLVDNAIKYTNRGGVTILAKIEDEKPQPSDKWAGPHPFPKRRWLKIAVSDTGIGMEKKEIDYFLQGRLFERGEEAKKLYGPGRGIGLSIAIEFIKSHGGKIWAESEGWGKGTTFWIELPV